MPAALLDTNAISDLMRNHARLKARVAAHRDPILTSVVAWGEIRYGLAAWPRGRSAATLRLERPRSEVLYPASLSLFR